MNYKTVLSKKFLFLVLMVISAMCIYQITTKFNINPNHKIGEVIDSLDNVEVFYNGGVNHVLKRNLSIDGYNLGLSYQCVEFVKRYYYQHYHHKMPDTYGHAKNFFDQKLENGAFNRKRGLYQYKNGDGNLPNKGDILIFSPTIFNPFGHVAIVSHVSSNPHNIEIIQQNAGPFSSSRAIFTIKTKQNKAYIDNKRIIGWLSTIDMTDINSAGR